MSSGVVANSLDTNATELATLRAQNHLIKEYQAALLDTVYWALTGVVTMAVLLTGFTGFINFKFYESDKARLKEELSRMVTDHAAQMQAEFAVQERRMLGTVADRGNDLTVAISQKIESATDRISRETLQIRDELAETKKDFSLKIMKLNERLQVVTEADEEQTNVADTLEANMREIEELIWELKGNHLAMLITQSQTLDAAIRANSEYQVKNALERMKKTIENRFLPPSATKLTKATYSVIMPSIKNAVKSNAVLAVEVEELLSKVKVDS